MNTHAHSIPVNNSERLSWLDLKIYEVGHTERLVIDTDVTSN
jgi:hypothetical protein